MKGIIKKRGNSAWVRIPTRVLRAAGLKSGQVIEIREQRRRVVIKSTENREYGLKELVKGITHKNRHKLADFDHPVGAEW